MAISLYPHNASAYEAAVSMLAETGKAAVVHPTGTGKSFIAFKLCEDNPDKRICWLAPSEYIFRTQLENLRKTDPLAFPGAPGSLNFELFSFHFQNILFLTYARLMMMDDAEIAEIKPDYIILDEFHRCGAEQWGRGVRSLLTHYPDTPILGLTATNIRYLDNQRDMADELFDGCIASEMTLGEAIVRGILPAPKYVLSLFKYRDDLAKYELRARKAKNKAVRSAAEEILEKLRRALDRAIGMDALFEKHMADRHGKYLVFCAGAEHMRDMMSHVSDWFSGVDPHPHVYSAYSDDPAADRSFADFKADTSDHLKLLFCIDMLNEGIHVDDISGVILLRPTVSPIIYKQQIGRALSANKATRPIIFDIVLNIENLCSVSSLQEEMAAAVSYYRDLGMEEPFVDGFEVVDEVRDCLELFDRLNDTLTASWDLMYAQAERYYRENGDLNVPQRYSTAEGYSLGSWLDTQRRVRSGKIVGTLTPAQIGKLDALGMRWESMSDLSWEKYYAAAVRYQKAHGDLLVKYDYVDGNGVALGDWILNLRTYKKSGIRSSYMTPERIEKLDALGMTWDVPDLIFEKNFAAALAWYRRHGDLDVPTSYADENGVRLGSWIANLRQRKRMGKLGLSPEQTARLDAIGMIWASKNDVLWEKGYEHARSYYNLHQNLRVENSYYSPDGYRLGGWISDQREKYRLGVMKPERKQKLDAIGMIWTTGGRKSAAKTKRLSTTPSLRSLP